MLKLIQREIAKAEGNEQDRSGAANPDAGILSTQVPTIGTIAYTTTPLRVGEAETLKVQLIEYTTRYMETLHRRSLCSQGRNSLAQGI